MLKVTLLYFKPLEMGGDCHHLKYENYVYPLNLLRYSVSNLNSPILNCRFSYFSQIVSIWVIVRKWMQMIFTLKYRHQPQILLSGLYRNVAVHCHRHRRIRIHLLLRVRNQVVRSSHKSVVREENKLKYMISQYKPGK